MCRVKRSVVVIIGTGIVASLLLPYTWAKPGPSPVEPAGGDAWCGCTATSGPDVCKSPPPVADIREPGSQVGASHYWRSAEDSRRAFGTPGRYGPKSTPRPHRWGGAAVSDASPSGFVLPSLLPGVSGVPHLEWDTPGLNDDWTAGPFVRAGVNGTDGGSPVFLGTGAAWVDATDFYMPLNGMDWWHTRMYSTLSSSSLTWQGESWWGDEMMNITLAGQEGASDVTWEVDPHYSFTFTYDSELGFYNAPNDNYQFSINFDSGNDEYTFESDDGWAWTFHDKNHTNSGKLKRLEDPYDNDWAFTYSSGKLTDIVVGVVAGSDHKITYTYFTSGDNNGKLQYIKVYKTTTTTDANLIGKIEHVYHDSTADDYGTTGDLMKVIVSRKATADGDGTLSIEETYRYRYYKGTYNASTNPGTDHQLKYVLFPENAQRLNDDIGTPETQSNSDWADHANVAYEYDSNGRVRQTDERAPGLGCGCSGGGSAGTTTYTWSVNGGSPNADTWNIHCVADREDDSRVIFDVTRLYNILTWVVQDEDDGTPTKELIWHVDYKTSGFWENRVTAIYMPSACSAYDESSPYGVTLNSSTGLVYSVEFDVLGGHDYPEKIRVKKGTGGTADTLIKYGRTISQRRDLVTTITHYESGSEGDGRATTLSYTFYDSDKHQVKQLDITHPSVSTAKNGPGASAVEKRFYDKRDGAMRWTLDGEGYVTFHAYDDETGVVELAVGDVNTTTLMTVVDDAWDGVAHGGLAADDTVPFARTGGGTALDIDASQEIDWLGRVRKAIDDGGTITYNVFKDDELRTYIAWNTTTYKPLMPIRITKTDKDGRVEETLQLKTSVTPTKDGSNEPTGAETYVNGDWAARTVNAYNLSGTMESAKRYHYVPTSGDGARYTNYYQTDFEYDSMGRVEYTIADVDDESTYDREQVTQNFYDFLGRTIKVATGVSDNTHNITTGKPTLNTTVEYFFDDPDSDSTPEQGEGDGNLEWIRTWHGTGASDNNDTEYRYDWRNRRQLIIPPLAPYTLNKHDNLDRETAQATYSSTTNLDPGDDPATTENTARLDLSKTYYDEWGRVYKTESFDDPADVTPADELATSRYYDRRGLGWALDAANTGIRLTKYDGTGRRTETSRGTQFDSVKYTSNAPDYPDDDEGIVTKTEFTLDEDGNVQKIITTELNHDDTNGMGTSDFIRTYRYSYYDDADRLTDTANFGTNNSNGWKDNSTAPGYDNDGGVAGDQPPTRSDTILVTSYTYDNEGRREKVTDPKAIDTKSVYDTLGRVIAKIEDEGGGKLNRKTEYQFNAQGGLERIIHDPDADNTFADGVWTMVGTDVDQVTEYAYTQSQDASWVAEIKYPTGDGTVGSVEDDKIVFTYNVEGTLATRTDQNGTVLTWSYDALRRRTEEEVTTVGSYTGGSGSVDSAIRAFTWQYDNESRVQFVTSHTDTTPDTSSYTDAANQIKYTYNAADRLTKEEQEEDGAVDVNTKSVQYTFGTDYTSTGNYNRLNYVTYPDGRKIWNGYTHSGGAGTLQDTINDEFNIIGQIAKDSSGSIGNLIAEYDRNGRSRVVRRVHDDGTGTDGNDTRMDLWHGTSGQYDGLDRFGRIVDMKHTEFDGTATDLFDRIYTHDRNGNRESIKHTQSPAESQSFTYDNLNRLTDGDRGILNSSDVVQVSDVGIGYNMDLLGNFTPGDGGLKFNGATSTITHAVNATNEITTHDVTNPAGAPSFINDPFTTAISSFWSQDKGTWSISSSKINVDTLTSGDAVLLADPDVDVASYEVTVTFPTGSSTNKAGVFFSHDGSNSYHAVVLDRNASKISLHKITSGSWGGALGSATATINDSTAYTIKVARKQSNIVAGVVGQSTARFTYNTSTAFAVGKCGLYSDKTSVTFDDFKAFDATRRDPQVSRADGFAAASISTNKLLVDADEIAKRGGRLEIRTTQTDLFTVVADVELNGGADANIWVRTKDPENGYRMQLDSNGNMKLEVVKHGDYTSLATNTYTTATSVAVVMVMDVAPEIPQIRVWVDGTLKLTNSNSLHPVGAVAFSGEKPKFDNIKIGYDNNSDRDLDDPGDDVFWSDDFDGGTPTQSSFAYDDAGNLVDDTSFRYTYDAWNRLVKVQSSEDGGAVTFQTAEFDATGRRLKKVVTDSGYYNGTVVYFYDGHRIIETRDGSGNLFQQFIRGTQYVDELIMVRVKGKGDLYIHQDANWNVVGVTDLARRIVERQVYNPYGEVTVHQETGFGDYDGDGDVDATDRTGISTCNALLPGRRTSECNVMDLDFDGDWDSNDETLFDALPQGDMVSPGLAATAVDQPFGHQGLLFEPEIGSYQNRARQYAPSQRRFGQRDPLSLPGSQHFSHASLGLMIGGAVYEYTDSAPAQFLDPTGLCTPTNYVGCATTKAKCRGKMKNRNSRDDTNNCGGCTATNNEGYYCFTCTRCVGSDCKVNECCYANVSGGCFCQCCVP